MLNRNDLQLSYEIRLGLETMSSKFFIFSLAAFLLASERAKSIDEPDSLAAIPTSQPRVNFAVTGAARSCIVFHCELKQGRLIGYVQNTLPNTQVLITVIV